MTVLVTGFEPFAGHRVNSAAAVARRLDGREVGGRKLTGHILPVEFGVCIPEIGRLIDLHRPELVVSLGLAASSTRLHLERAALNLIDCTIPDNAGRQPVDVSVVPGGPGGYLTRLPVKAMAAAMNRAGAGVSVQTALSLSAGTYGCNAVMYAALHHTRDLPTRCGFIHLPPLEVLPAGPVSEVIVAGIAAALQHEVDLPVAGGELE